MTELEKDALRVAETLQNFNQHVVNMIRMVRELSLLGDHLKVKGDEVGLKILADAIKYMDNEPDGYKKN